MHVVLLLMLKSFVHLNTLTAVVRLCRYAINEGARWSSGINAANGARGPRFASRILPTVQRP